MIHQHIQQHMNFLAGNMANAGATAGAQPPNAPPPHPNAVMTGNHPQPQPSPAVNQMAPAQGQAMQDGTHLPNPPSQPMQPKS